MDDFEASVKKKAKKIVQPNVEGDFECQDCGEDVTEAYADRKTGVLIWTCSQGHTSRIKDLFI